MQRLSKFLSSAGIASRRDAEKLIAAGRIKINGKTVESPVSFVSKDDTVSFDGKKIAHALCDSSGAVALTNTAPGTRTTLYLFHKPTGCICSARDPQGRRTIYDVLGEKYRNLKYVGRLDYNTSGLLLLTNDGGLARQLTLPSTGLERTYIAKLGGTMTMDDAHLNRILTPLKKGLKLNGIIYKPMNIRRMDASDVRVTITEGKKNEIRRAFEAVGLPVRKLHRISYGQYELGALPPGHIRKV